MDKSIHSGEIESVELHLAPNGTGPCVISLSLNDNFVLRSIYKIIMSYKSLNQVHLSRGHIFEFFNQRVVSRFVRMSDSTDINIRLWSLSCPMVDLNLALMSFSFENALSGLLMVLMVGTTQFPLIFSLHHNIKYHVLFHRTSQWTLQLSFPFLHSVVNASNWYFHFNGPFNRKAIMFDAQKLILSNIFFVHICAQRVFQTLKN